MRWRQTAGVRWLEADLPGGRAAFSTRLGGVSKAPFDRLNLGALSGDQARAVAENRRRLARALGFEAERVVAGRQVHGTEIAQQTASLLPSSFPAPRSKAAREVDGHLVAEPGLAALVFVADCLPIALAGPGGVAILHCGWRGMAAGILAKGMQAVAGTHAVIGPGIGPCCYEVGEEVMGAFAGLGEGVSAGRMLDLPEVARRLLQGAGVSSIESAGLCTACEARLFFSHRRDAGRTGRQAGVVWVDGKAGEPCPA
jgi:purine-nucleoside/S-methyl-5'-thioadenosine phosphorylase / adenosine deaminase